MTSYPMIRDWKVSTAHRVLVWFGWGLALLALYFVVLAFAFGAPRLWGAGAALAGFGVVLGAGLPEPVPHDMLDGASTRITTRR